MSVVTKRTRERMREQLQTRFEREARRLADKLFVKGARTRDWHRAMARLVKQNLLQNALAGAGRPLTQVEIRQLNKISESQLSYLSRFADKVALKRMRHESITADGVANQAMLYAGEGRGQWFEFFERSSDPEALYEYVARGDSSSCSPCINAASGGPYKAADGPFPGSVCKGRGRCRCRRVLSSRRVEA